MPSVVSLGRPAFAFAPALPARARRLDLLPLPLEVAFVDGAPLAVDLAPRAPCGETSTFPPLTVIS